VPTLAYTCRTIPPFSKERSNFSAGFVRPVTTTSSESVPRVTVIVAGGVGLPLGKSQNPTIPSTIIPAIKYLLRHHKRGCFISYSIHHKRTKPGTIKMSYLSMPLHINRLHLLKNHNFLNLPLFFIMKV